MHIVVERLPELTGAEGAIVELVDGGEMVYRAVSGLASPFAGLRLKRSSSLSGLCVDQARMLICEDSETDPRVDREACRKVGLRSMVVAPLMYRGEAVGVLKNLWDVPQQFGEDTLLVLELMSELLAASLYHAFRFQNSELLQRASRDELTGAANRAFLWERLNQARSRADEDGFGFALLMLDMDGLKSINDTLGHRFGDAALKELANRLKATGREGDCVARLGGDEFCVLLQSISDSRTLESIARRVADRLKAPLPFENEELSVQASIGMAHYPDDAKSVDELMDCADQRMYQAKRMRKGPG